MNKFKISLCVSSTGHIRHHDVHDVPVSHECYANLVPQSPSRLYISLCFNYRACSTSHRVHDVPAPDAARGRHEGGPGGGVRRLRQGHDGQHERGASTSRDDDIRREVGREGSDGPDQLQRDGRAGRTVV